MIKTLFLIHHPLEDASSRYRIYQFVPFLEENGFICHVRAFSTPRLFFLIRNGGSPVTQVIQTIYCTARRLIDIFKLGDYDLVFINREAFPFFSPLIEQIVLRSHKKVVLGLDDAVYVGHDRKALKYSWLYRFKYGSGLNKILPNFQLVIAGSQVIADHVRQFTSRVRVIPTVVDLHRYPFTLPPTIDNRKIIIGWYGSSSTSPYLQHVVPALEKLAEAHPGQIRFRFFGNRRLSIRLPELEVLPFCLESEIEDLQSIDIGLMPMPDTEWTRAKCAFKAIQYMALGIPTVVTPVGMSAEVVRNEENGLHASTPDDWFEQLNRLVCDLELRRRLALAARKWIEENYSLCRWQQEFADCLRDVYEGKDMCATGASSNVRRMRGIEIGEVRE